MDSNNKNIKYSDLVGVRVQNKNGDSEFIPYNVAVNSGLVSSGEDLANMQDTRYAFKDASGAYTSDFTNAYPSASVKMDSNGKITVTIPEEWQEDEQVKKYTDNYMLENISKNYKANKDVKYQDPYDETKQVTTEEWIKELNEGLKFRIQALNVTGPVKAELISRYGGSPEKNKIINNLTTEDIITMSAQFDNDDSWVPLPKYMLLAYPQLQLLESYTNGWVKKKDYLDNFYNIEDNKITEENAKGIAETPEKMLAEVEDMDPEEVAKTIAFGNFIVQVDPKRSNWDQFLQAGDALSRGFYGGFYDWGVETSNLIANIGNLSLIKGESIDTRDFWNGLIANISSAGANPSRGDSYNFTDDKYGFDVTAYMGKSMQDMAYTNKDALSKAQAGYVQGRLAGQAVDTFVTLIAVGEATRYLSDVITAKITERGARAISAEMAAEAAYQSGSTAVATGAQAAANTVADATKLGEAVSKVAKGSAAYKAFFLQTWDDALRLYTNALGGTTLVLQSMNPAQLANIVNSASKIATMATYANTAVGVLGNMVFAAIVGNKELTTKVLSSNATSDEAKTWIQSVMWDTAKITAFSYLTNIAVERFGEPIKNSKLAKGIRKAKQKASQKMTGFTEKVSTPWVNFMKWFNSNRTAAAKAASNARTAQAEAIREAVIANEARQYMTTLSTEQGSYGIKIVEEALKNSGVRPGVSMSETLDNLARAGVILDPANLNLSEFEAGQANYVALRNALSNWDDVQTAVSQVVHEFNNPNIYPIISEQLSELNKANSELLKVEQSEGLLSKEEIKKNKSFLKEDEGYIYAEHSPELSRYIVRGYELKIIANEGRMLGHENLEEYEPYKEAKARLEDAASKISPALREIADNKYVPALKSAESSIIDVMVDAGSYPRAFVEAMRSSGKFGPNGEDWLRLVARRDTPQGAYSPYSGTVKRDNTLSINRFRILDDEDITWPGNGLQQLILEYGTNRSEKELKENYKAATGKTTEIVMSGKKTRNAGIMEEFKGELDKAIKQGIKSFVQSARGSVAIGRKRSAEQSAFLKEVADIGGIETIDIDALRVIMQDKGVPLAESIVDQESLEKFFETSSDEAKKILIDAVGESIGTPDITEETFSGLMENENFQKILRGELEKTSLQTGYGIKDTRARLNAQVPGFDVLDWSLLGRAHVNGLVPGGFYADMDDNIVKAYIMSVDDLRELLNLPEKGPTSQLSSMGEKFWKHINTIDGNAVIPISLRSNLGDRGKLRFNPRGGKSMGNDVPDSGHLALYLEALKDRGITKIPVAISFNKTTLAHESRIGKFFDSLDKAIATGKKPDITVEDVAYALKELVTKERVKGRIRNAALESEMSDKQIDALIDKAEKYNAKIAAGDKKDNFGEIDFESQINKVIDANSFFKGIELKDITSDIQKAFSEYGKIPFYRGQSGLGDFYSNGGDSTGQVGDAYWLSPNASYTDRYGNGDKLAGSISVDYLLSDKAKNDFVRESYEKVKKLEKKMSTAIKKAVEKDADIKELIKDYPEYLDGNLAKLKEQEADLEYEFLEGSTRRGWEKTVEAAEKALTKNQLEEYTKLNRLINFDNVTGKNGIIESDKHVIKRYNELAEYLKKPVIDISEDGFADGTAFFYYKGVDPKFDKEVGDQLKIQSNAVVGHGWDAKALEKEMLNWDGVSVDELIDNITMGNGLGEEWESTLEEYENGEIDLADVNNVFEDLVTKLTVNTPNVRKVILEAWNGSPYKPDLKSAWFHYIDPNLLAPVTTIDGATAAGFLREMGVKEPTKNIKVSAKDKKAWDDIDPRNVANVPIKPSFKQPENVSYRDYELGLAENEALSDTIYEALKNEQYNKLAELKDNYSTDYENLLNNLDRANAKVNSDVKNSEEVQVAAEEYRNNIKDFENAVLFNQKFSYMIKSETAKNTISSFAKENNIELPEGKISAKTKLKTVLWQMLLDGKDIPAIKGLKKSDIDDIKNAISMFNGVKNGEDSGLKGVDREAELQEIKKSFYKMLDETELYKNADGPNPLKYELDEKLLYQDIDDAIDGMMEKIKMNSAAESVISGAAEYQDYEMSDARFEFTVLNEILSKENKKELANLINNLSHRVVDNLIPEKSVIIKGNESALYKKVETAINDKLEARFATAKTMLESMGETVESTTITELLEKYRSKISDTEKDVTIIKTMDENGEIQYESVSPALADIWNNRTTYSPINGPMKVLNNLAILKKISTTDLSPRSFAKQAASDPAMAFATVGALPGTLHAISDEIGAKFGSAILREMEKTDPIRFKNIEELAKRKGITPEEAFVVNSEAIARTQVPFTLLNAEILRQANISKFGNSGAAKLSRKNLNEKINSALRRTSDKLGWFQNKRETYVRLYAGEKAFMDALNKGYNLQQAEAFREYALNTATSNFRSKHTMFNSLRSTVPYLTSGISGAKSFWQMFELDPIGVTSRIFTGFIAPILYFAGEIFSDENLKKKYEALAESEKENHIVIAIGGELVLIPVGEEIGKYTNVVMHVVESLYTENQYDFWNLMLNDLVGLIPGVDFTGFTDPEMWEDISGDPPTFLEVTKNGIGKMLSEITPPVIQSGILVWTGTDLYTGRRINSDYITIDEEGNPITMSYSTSQFAKVLANVVGGDAKVLERAISGTVGTVGLHTLDTITSAVQFIIPGGEEGSLTTAVEKTMSDLSAPFTAHGYNSLDRRFNYAVSDLFRRKEKIESDGTYIEYNQKIASEKDSKQRQKYINKRNEMFADYLKRVEDVVKGFRAAGGTLDKWRLSKVVSLITFEDAVRADRQFMDINTNYSDARKQAIQTLYDMGITNPDGPSSLGYIYTDDEGRPQLAMWTPYQMQIIQNQYYEQKEIHAARITAILDDGTDNSIKKQFRLESDAEQPYWDKYNATGKLSNSEWDELDNLRKAHNAKVVLALKDYMNTYGAENVLSNDKVIDAISEFIQVPSEYETVKGRYISSDNGKLDKKEGFKESYIKTIFGVR